MHFNSNGKYRIKLIEFSPWIIWARNVRLYYPYWQYTDLFIFRFVNSNGLTQRLTFFNSKMLKMAFCDDTENNYSAEISAVDDLDHRSI